LLEPNTQTQANRLQANDAVHAALKKAILTSVMLPGERLNPGDLAQQLGVSLTPVRNAIQVLAAEGLVEVRPRSGTFVARVTARELEETFDIRAALECLAAEKATARPDLDQAVEELRGWLHALDRPVRTERDRVRHEQDNAEFHLCLIRASGSSRLRETYQALNAHITIGRIHAAQVDWADRLPQEQREHLAIVDSLAARDLAAAQTAIRSHIERAKRSLAAALRQNHDEDPAS
jgi:DNA-binding GntR family transcriptional regulator